jgi:RecB family exonuclease
MQNFAACPYRFVLQALHRLAPREEPVAIEKIDPLEKGSLVHETLFELFQQLLRRGLVPITAETFEEMRVELERILDEVAERYRDKLAPAIDKVWNDGIASIRADLLEFLRRETFERAPWIPWKLELAFGLKGGNKRDASSSDEPVLLDCGITLRGSIDLVERDATGQLRATDYKTGKHQQKPDSVIGGGESLQPVFYALALEKLFPGQKVVGGRLSYGTSAGEFREVKVALERPARDAADRMAATLGQALTTGFLPAAPKKGACRYCDYRPICGPWEEERTSKKTDRGELTALKALRAIK